MSAPVRVAVGQITHPSPQGVHSDPSPNTQPRLQSPGRILAWYDQYRKILLSLAVLAYCAGFTGRWLPEPDSALYLELGRNLATGKGYTYQLIPNNLAYPGLPLLWAGIDRLSGADHLRWHHLAMLLMGLALIGLVYRLFALHAGRSVGVVIASMTAMTYGVYRYSFELRNDLPFTLGVMALLVGLEGIRRRRGKPTDFELAHPEQGVGSRMLFDWVLAIGGVIWLILMRPHMWVVLAALIAASCINVLRMWKKSRRLKWTLLLPAALAIVGIAIFSKMDLRQTSATASGLSYEMQLVPTSGVELRQMIKNIAGQLPVMFGGETVKATLGHELGPVLNTLAATGAILGGVMLVRRRPVWGLLVIGMLLAMLAHEPLTRYYLPILPLLAYGWWLLSEKIAMWIGHRTDRRFGEMLFVGLIILWVMPNFLRTLNMMGAQRNVHVAHSDPYAKYAAIESFSKRVELICDPGSIVMVPEKMGRIVTYLSRRNAQDSAEVLPLEYILKWRRLYVIEPVDAAGEAKIATSGVILGPELATADDPANGQRLVLRELFVQGHLPDQQPGESAGGSAEAP